MGASGLGGESGGADLGEADFVGDVNFGGLSMEGFFVVNPVLINGPVDWEDLMGDFLEGTIAFGIFDRKRVDFLAKIDFCDNGLKKVGEGRSLNLTIGLPNTNGVGFFIIEEESIFF